MRPVRCPECQGTRWLVFPAPVFFDSATNRDDEVIEVERIRCASCEHEAPFLSPEGEAVLARYAAVLGRLGEWSKGVRR